jgi:hypothetical protein
VSSLIYVVRRSFHADAAVSTSVDQHFWEGNGGKSRLDVPYSAMRKFVIAE